jgi:hypothetical protein
MVEHEARMRKLKYSCNMLVRKSESNMPVVRQKCNYEDNIKMDLKKQGFECERPQLPQIGPSGPCTAVSYLH